LDCVDAGMAEVVSAGSLLLTNQVMVVVW